MSPSSCSPSSVPVYSRLSHDLPDSSGCHTMKTLNRPVLLWEHCRCSSRSALSILQGHCSQPDCPSKPPLLSPRCLQPLLSAHCRKVQDDTLCAASLPPLCLSGLF